MKNIKAVVKKSQNIIQTDRSTWVRLYYSPTKDTVYTSEGEGRFHVTNLINPNTEEDIKEVVERWKRC